VSTRTGRPEGNGNSPPLVTSGLRTYDDNGCHVAAAAVLRDRTRFCSARSTTHSAVNCSEPRVRTPGVERTRGESWKLIPSILQERPCASPPWRNTPLAFHKERCTSHQVHEEHLDAPSMATYTEGNGVVEKMWVALLKRS
jgi:hypothetical protein